MNAEDHVYLLHISDAISQIEAYISTLTEDQFLDTTMVQDAVIRQLEIIGEATKHISKTFRETHAMVPWKDMAGMRDKLIHDYIGVDIEAVWVTATEDIPVLKTEVARYLAESN